ncbi:tetratricopeptide repeat protein [Colwellia ponticola]|uniref:Tetratricopeptide repeat protein n=1 Tax=Colwellia ponticola TaxID=2304625 RepID=A0A8H2JNB0_9GAMM|nr:tetratricopeptide repeat protein [Colwellia ponticola]TMM47647.1 tetratricopeptide repeat protein [Colwellia ponticola]
MIAITLDNFQQVIVDQSKEKLVLVSFWAEQIPESVALRDKLAARLANLDDHIILATVDCQSQGQIAQQFGIEGLPTAILLKDAQPLDGISGPQDDASIAVFLDKHLPKAEDIYLEQAKTALANKQLTEATNAIMQAYQADNSRADIKLVLIDVYLQTGKASEAKALLATITLVDQGSEYQALMAKVELAEQAANSPEIKALEAQLKAAPGDINLNQQLAAQYSQVNRQEDALTILFRLVQAGDEGTKARSKELFLDVLKALPDGDPLAIKFRRKLYTLLY